MALELSRIAAAAVESFLESERDAGRQDDGGRRRLATLGAVALGAGLVIAARGAYARARDIDLERVGAAIEDRLTQ